MVSKNPILVGSKGDIILSNAYFGKHLVLQGTSQFKSIFTPELAEKIVELIFTTEIPVIERERYAIVKPPYSIELIKLALSELEKAKTKIVEVEVKEAKTKLTTEVSVKSKKFRNLKEALTWLFETQEKEFEEIEKITNAEVEEEKELEWWQVIPELLKARNGNLALRHYLRLMHPPLVKSHPIQFSKFN